MDNVVWLANEFAGATPDCLAILEELARQYRALVVVPFYDDKNHNKKSSGLRQRFRPEAFSAYINVKHSCYFGLIGIGRRRKKCFWVVVGNAEIPITDIVEALQCCEDRNQPVPFNRQVLIEAVQALDSRDAENILRHAKAIEKQLLRFKRSPKKKSSGTDPDSTNDDRNKRLLVLASRDIRVIYNLSAKSIRDWAKDERKPFIHRISPDVRKYKLDPSHPELKSLEKKSSDKSDKK